MKELYQKFIGCGKCLSLALLMVLALMSMFTGNTATFNRVSNLICIATIGVPLFDSTPPAAPSELQKIPGVDYSKN